MFCGFGCASSGCPKLITSRPGKYKAQASEVTNRSEVTSEGTNRKAAQMAGSRALT